MSKFLPLFVLPPGCFFVMWAVGVVALKYSKRSGLIIIAGTFMLMYLVSTPLVSNRLVEHWENKYKGASPASTPPCLVIVLGGMFESTGRTTTPYMLNDSIDRIFAGIQLVKQGKAEKMIFTGGSQPAQQHRIPEADLMKQFVETYKLLPADKIWIENRAKNTYENALYTKNLLKEKGLDATRPVYLITSAYHMRRSVYIFKSMGFRVVPFPTDYQTTRMVYKQNILQVLPQAGSMYDVARVMREWFGLQYYKIKFLFS